MRMGVEEGTESLKFRLGQEFWIVSFSEYYL